MASKSAAAVLIDPLHAPEPSEETGLNSHFTSSDVQPAAPISPRQPSTPTRSSLGSNNPFRDSAVTRTPPQKDGASISERSVNGGSPRLPSSPYRDAAFGTLESPRQRAGSHGTPPSYEASVSSAAKSHHRRTSSLKQRYPGDESHQPLDIIRRDSRKADRSPHLKKRHQPGADTIDRLDAIVGGRAYHHEGPYDAALLARNSSFGSSPIAALKTSNEETIKATPEENVRDAVERHRPLDGTALIPSGQTDVFGRTYNYEEGADLQHEPSADDPGSRRWDDQEYDQADLKGKGEPQFSIDRAMQARKTEDGAIEMQEQSALLRDRDNNTTSATDNDVKRTGSIRAAGQNLKKRIGSLRHKKADE